jgi:hypothetical protein
LPTIRGLLAQDARELKRDEIASGSPVESGGETIETVGWVGGSRRRVVATHRPLASLFDIEGIGRFIVERAARRVLIEHLEVAFESEVFLEALLGPLLAIPLAADGVVLLHASAARIEDVTVLFLGESGAGKSTMVGGPFGGPAERWRTLADDIVPAWVGTDGLVGRFDFPQLKWGDTAAPRPTAMRQSRVDLLIDLGRPGSESTARIESRLRTAAQRALLLAAHTVSARLFPRRLLEEHLDLCAGAAVAARAVELTFPRRFDVLPAVREEVRRQARAARPSEVQGTAR